MPDTFKDYLERNIKKVVTKFTDMIQGVKANLTSISVTGSTNSSGATITSGSFFYLNGVLVRAKTDIASNATFTENTNYELVTDGGLNEIAGSGSPGGSSSTMTGATSNTDGTAGELPAPLAGQENAVLMGKGSWDTALYEVLDRFADVEDGRCERYSGDLDDIVSNSIYYTPSTSTNRPASSASTGFVITILHDTNTNHAVQLWMPSQTVTELYFRRKTSSWSDWKRVCTADEKSYIGMIVQSTTLDTEAKVKSFYGGTTWIQHSGYMLRGATSSVTANQASNDGGADSISYTPSGSNSGGSVGNTAINTNQMPSHNHLEYKPVDTGSGPLVNRNKSGNINGDTIANDVGNIQWGWYTNKMGIYTSSTGSTQSHGHGFTNPTFTGTAATINTLPKYKNVYIWERTA